MNGRKRTYVLNSNVQLHFRKCRYSFLISYVKRIIAGCTCARACIQMHFTHIFSVTHRYWVSNHTPNLVKIGCVIPE